LDGRFVELDGVEVHATGREVNGDFSGRAARGQGRDKWNHRYRLRAERRLLISDGYGNARFSSTQRGQARQAVGQRWERSGTVRQPHGIAVDDQGIIYVADRQNGRLQRFDLNGKYLGEWTISAW